MGKYEDEMHAEGREALPVRMSTMLDIVICNGAGKVLTMTFDTEWLEVTSNGPWEVKRTREGTTEKSGDPLGKSNAR